MSTVGDRPMSVSAEHDPMETFLPIAKKQLEALYAGVRDVVYIEHLRSCRILFWSPGAEELFGYSGGEILEQSSLLLTPGANEPAAFNEGEGSGVQSVSHDVKQY